MEQVPPLELVIRIKIELEDGYRTHDEQVAIYESIPESDGSHHNTPRRLPKPFTENCIYAGCTQKGWYHPECFDDVHECECIGLLCDRHRDASIAYDVAVSSVLMKLGLSSGEDEQDRDENINLYSFKLFRPGGPMKI